MRGIAGVQVRKHEHRGAAGHLTARRQVACNGRVHGRIVLQRPVDHQLLAAIPGHACGLAHLLHFLVACRIARIADHRYPWRDTEGERRCSALARDLGEFGGIGVGVHHAVAVDQHLVREQHEEDRRDQAGARCGLDQLQCRADGVGRRVHQARDQAIDFIQG